MAAVLVPPFPALYLPRYHARCLLIRVCGRPRDRRALVGSSTAQGKGARVGGERDEHERSHGAGIGKEGRRKFVLPPSFPASLCMHAMSRLLKHIFTDIIFLGLLLHVSVEWPEKFQLFILFCGMSECRPMRVHFRGAAL